MRACLQRQIIVSCSIKWGGADMRRSFLAMQGLFELFDDPGVNALQQELLIASPKQPCSQSVARWEPLT